VTVSACSASFFVTASFRAPLIAGLWTSTTTWNDTI
jgi:hypothetical protein